MRLFFALHKVGSIRYGSLVTVYNLTAYHKDKTMLVS